MTKEHLKRPEGLKEKHLDYLDDLRKSLSVNMYAAGPIMVDEFGLTKQEATSYVSYWMTTFAKRQEDKG